MTFLFSALFISLGGGLWGYLYSKKLKREIDTDSEELKTEVTALSSRVESLVETQAGHLEQMRALHSDALRTLGTAREA